MNTRRSNISPKHNYYTTYYNNIQNLDVYPYTDDKEEVLK